MVNYTENDLIRSGERWNTNVHNKKGVVFDSIMPVG